MIPGSAASLQSLNCPPSLAIAPQNCHTNSMNKTTYEITCPALGETETTTDLDRAMDLCFSMHDESDSYAFIRDSFGDIVGEYGDIMQAVADHLV